MLLVLAPLASLSLAGQEHGRTIPLAELADGPPVLWTAYGAQPHDAVSAFTGWVN